MAPEHPGMFRPLRGRPINIFVPYLPAVKPRSRRASCWWWWDFGVVALASLLLNFVVITVVFSNKNQFLILDESPGCPKYHSRS